MRSSFQDRCQVFARCGFALLLFQCCGCAHLATVKTQPARLPTGLRAEEPLDSATKHLMTAEHAQPSITEQLWDADDLPDGRMKRGRPTGAAMPLCWSHAEYVSLVR